MKLDAFLPHYHFHETHRLRVKAKPEAVFQAVKTLTVAEMSRPVYWLLALREWPAKWLGRSRPGEAQAPNRAMTFLEEMLASDFVLLNETPGREVVLGLVGKFWEISPQSVVLSTPEEFMDFGKPGYAKVAANLLILSQTDGVWLSTETRILALDQAARRKFARYWFVIALGSSLIRWFWLYAIKRKAEKAGRDKRT